MTKTNQLEKHLNKINLTYRKENKAVILKVPVPIIYTQKGLIAEQSTVDYTGILTGGQYIAYDAKETKLKTSFPLSNLHQHQLVYLDMIHNLGGISFLAIHFTELYKNEIFITNIPFVKHWYFNEKRKSIPIDQFDKNWLIDINIYLDKVLEIKESLCINTK